jgi:hypothetical protein
VFVSIALDILVAVYILSRQRRIRPVPRVLSLRLPVILGVIGLIDVLSYTDTHHPTGTDYEWVLGTLVVGAIGLGALRALTVKIWTSNEWVLRQGTALTIFLWLVSLGLHFLSGIGAQQSGAGNLEAASLLLYLGVTYGVQNAVVHRRAAPLWDALGPDAGRGPLAFFASFGGGPQGFGRGPQGFGRGPQGFVRPSDPHANTPAEDPTIIDAEVIDDEGPPELR